jgi:hypothetical protein
MIMGGLSLQELLVRKLILSIALAGRSFQGRQQLTVSSKPLWTNQAMLWILLTYFGAPINGG